MPTKIGGGGKPQEYDPRSGRYGCGASGYSRTYGRAQSVLSIFSAKAGQDQTSERIPNYKKAITPDEKFIKYSLDENHAIGKYKAYLYKKVLGFTKENYGPLKAQVHQSITTGTAKLNRIERNEFGVIKFECAVDVIGANGNKATVVAVYGIGPKDGKPRMITNY
ncbi:MAG: hypothetical protein J5601_01135, partial [Elusimicrobiaceae bacterium]|nr:hypothetical protein [Elusimicrobiaceae bacterium]